MSEAGLDFSADAYISGIWFISHDDDLPVHERADWLCALSRAQPPDSPPGDWKLTYRFRYHHSEDVWESQDEKSWSSYGIAGHEPEEKIRDTVEALASVISARHRQPVNVVDVRGNSERAMALLQQQPWVHFRQATPQEADALRRRKPHRNTARRPKRRY